jgi:hypothetical protein
MISGLCGFAKSGDQRHVSRARRKIADGKPYLIDVEGARHGPGWTDDP